MNHLIEFAEVPDGQCCDRYCTGVIRGGGYNGQADRIRLNGIACPEKCQAFGKRAKQVASDLAFGKEVITRSHDEDKRTLADVLP